MSSGSWFAFSHNPGIYGAVPAGWTSAALTACWGAYWYQGTSIGLDRPIFAILQDVAAALDPQGLVLPSAWNFTKSLVPCSSISCAQTRVPAPPPRHPPAVALL